MNFENTKAFMDSLTSWIIPGNTISVYHKNKEVFSYSSGYASLEEKRKMQGDELFNIYSCSKITTVVCALQLLERGLLDLDAPVYDYISEYRELYVKTQQGPRLAKAPVLVRNLFTHTAGLHYDIKSENICKMIEKTNGNYTSLDLAKAITRDTLLFEPGEAWSYSLAHDVLAALVELISGKRLSDYANENVFLPLGMEAYYHLTPSLSERMAEQYRFVSDAKELNIVESQKHSTRSGRLENAGKERANLRSKSYDSGGAGIITDAKSYAKLAGALAMRGVGDGGERILNEKTVDLLSQNHLNERQMSYITWPQLSGYGYGLGVRVLVDRKKAGFYGPLEFGWGGAGGSTVLCDTENGIGYFYSHHMLNPQEDYYQPRLRNAFYKDFLG